MLSSRGGVSRAVTSLGAATSASVFSPEMPEKCVKKYCEFEIITIINYFKLILCQNKIMVLDRET